MGATAVDFAYAVHSDVGNTCVGVTVEHKPYPLSKALESGQTVNIITDPNAHPEVAWLNFCGNGSCENTDSPLSQTAL